MISRASILNHVTERGAIVMHVVNFVIIGNHALCGSQTCTTSAGHEVHGSVYCDLAIRQVNGCDSHEVHIVRFRGPDLDVIAHDNVPALGASRFHFERGVGCRVASCQIDLQLRALVVYCLFAHKRTAVVRARAHRIQSLVVHKRVANHVGRLRARLHHRVGLGAEKERGRGVHTLQRADGHAGVVDSGVAKAGSVFRGGLPGPTQVSKQLAVARGRRVSHVICAESSAPRVGGRGTHSRHALRVNGHSSADHGANAHELLSSNQAVLASRHAV